jgi:hypothetical protein
VQFAIPCSLTRTSRSRTRTWFVASFTYERANAAFLTDGFYYLLYAGRTDIESFSGRGHAKLGLARGRDLAVWDVPRER